VGYVEDNESVEMIMKKFEALDEYTRELGEPAPAAPPPSTALAAVAAATTMTPPPTAATEAEAAGAAPAMSQAQLEELFKRTSHFTVRSALRPVAAAYGDDDDDDFVDALVGADGTDDDAYVLADASRDRQCTCMCLSDCQPVCTNCLSVGLCVCVSVCIYVCMYACRPVCLYAHASVCGGGEAGCLGIWTTMASGTTATTTTTGRGGPASAGRAPACRRPADPDGHG
jgi:hypothetical protein